MAINKKFISFATQAQFDAKVAELDDRSIVFIEDTKRIWTHGVFFDTPWNHVTGKPTTLSGYGITDAALKVNSLYYVEGNTSGTAGSWTGTIPEITSLYTGLTIAYKIGVSGASTTNLDINGYGNILVRRNTSNLTTQLPAGTVVILTYDGTYWVWADYTDGTESYTVRWNAAVKAGAQITRYKLLVQGSDGRYYPTTIGDTTGATKTISTVPFLIGSPIIFYLYTSTIAAGGVTSSSYNYTGVTTSTTTYAWNQNSGWRANEDVYLKGTVNGALFTLDNTTLTSHMTQDLPTTEDGFYYMRLGMFTNTTTGFRLSLQHPVYYFADGELQSLNTSSGADWNDIRNLPSTFTPSAHTLGSHSDVAITSNTSGEILKWNGTNWINNTLTEANIASLTDLNSYLLISEFSKYKNVKIATTEQEFLDICASQGEYTKYIDCRFSGINVNSNRTINIYGAIVIVGTLPINFSGNYTLTFQDLTNSYSGIYSWNPFENFVIINGSTSLRTVTINLNNDISFTVNYLTLLRAVVTIQSSGNDGGLSLNYGILKLLSGSSLAGKVNQLNIYALPDHLHTGVYEPVFTKNTAFNKNFGTTAGTVAEGNHTHNYLPLTGGTLTGSIYNILELKRSTAAGSSILFSNSGGSLGKFGFTSDGVLHLGTGSSTDGQGDLMQIVGTTKATTFYGTVTAPSFSGSLIGNADTATKLSSITTTFTGTYPVAFNVNGSIYSNSNITYTGSTNTLTATNFNGNASTATNISNSGTVTLATAIESNAITITQPSYVSEKPVKLLNFNWYATAWSLGNIRGGGTNTQGLGIYLDGVEKFRFLDGSLKVGSNTVYHSGNFTPGNYLPLAGGIMTGILTLNGQLHSPTVISILNGSAAQGINIGQLLVSNAYADVTKVPTNGIYSKGGITIDGALTANLSIYLPTNSHIYNGSSAILANGASYIGIGDTTTGTTKYIQLRGANIKYRDNNGVEYDVWHSGNDGADSGLDADKLDGYNSSHFNHRNYTDVTNYLGGYYTSGGLEKPNHAAFGAGKLKLAMLAGSNVGGISGTYVDTLWMSGYSGGDVKYSTALHFDKYNQNIYFTKQNWDATAWGTTYTFWTSANLNPVTINTAQTITAQKTFSDGDANYGINQKPSINLGANDSTKAGALKFWGNTIGAYGLIHMTTSAFMINSSQGNLYLQNSSAGNVYTVTGGGLMGVGTSLPDEKLDVLGNIRLSGGTEGRYITLTNSGALRFTAGTGGWASSLSYNLSDNTALGSAAGAYGTATALTYFFYGGTYNAPSMVILPNGRVGIGLTTPGYNLGVAGTIGSTGNIVSAGNIIANTGITIAQNGGTGMGISLYSTAGVDSSTNPTYGIMFATTANKGTHGAVTGDWATYFTMNTTTGRGWIFTTAPAATTGNVASISNTGHATFSGLTCANIVFPGASSSVTSLIVSAGQTQFRNGTNAVLSFSGMNTIFGGTITATAGYKSSDITLKTNINDLLYQDLLDIDNIHLNSFNWIKSNNKDYGVIAQEVEKYRPELVSETNGKKTVNYESFYALKIARLEQRIKELEIKIWEN